jgi:hypothetical protein
MKVVQNSAANNYKHYLKVQIEELSSEIGLRPNRLVSPSSPHLEWVLCSVLPVVFRCY